MKPRHKAREFVLQAIYQWQLTSDPISSIEAQFYDAANKAKADFNYFTKLLHGVIENCDNLDDSMKQFLDRKLTDLNPVELAILRLATYELKYCPDVPYKVVINEALEIAKTFGSIEGFKYVNGILDKVAKEIRQVERGVV